MDDATCHEQIDEIVRAHCDTLLLFARQWSADAAEDVVQESFLRLMKRMKTTGLPDDVRCWLFRVVRNELTARHHRRWRRRRREEQVASAREAWFEPANDARLDAAKAARQLAGLPLDQRETVVLRIWGGLAFEDIANLTNTSRSTAHRRYIAAIDTLRKRLALEE